MYCNVANCFFMKKKDNSEPLQSVKAKILEKPIQQGEIE